MSYIRILISIFSVFLTLTIVGSAQNLSPSKQINQFSNGWRIKTRLIRQSNKSKRFTINAKYPEIIGRKMNDWRTFNALAKAMVVIPVNDFSRTMSTLTAEEVKDLPSTGNQLDVDYEIKLANEHFISIQFGYSDFSNGMAHALFYQKSLNFEVRTKRELKLADLFKPQAKYLETIAAFCLKELKKRPPVNGQKLADGEWAAGAAADEENYKNWNLTRRGLLITFGFYQIAPYPAGVNEVLIPFAELQEMARSDGILVKMMKQSK